MLLYGKKMTVQNKAKVATINSLTSLHGVARRRVEHVVEKLSEDEHGFEKTLKILDVVFEHDDCVEAPKALENFFYAAGRQADQTLAYVAGHKEKKREVEPCAIPESISGWLLLRPAGLSAGQRHMLMSQRTMKVEDVLYFLFGQVCHQPLAMSLPPPCYLEVEDFVPMRSTLHMTRPLTMQRNQKRSLR